MIHALPNVPQEDTVNYLREALARSERGEVIAIVLLEIEKGGDYSITTTGNPNTFEVAGMLAQMTRCILEP